MSWQDYVDNNLLGSGRLSKACIIGLPEGSTWASSSQFSLNADESSCLVKAFSDPSNIRSNGLYVNGQRVVLLKFYLLELTSLL